MRCGGDIIKQRTVILAARCFLNKDDWLKFILKLILIEINNSLHLKSCFIVTKRLFVE
ncbi:hypothetical protein CSC14_2328 [Proteus mirabilis]|nr:hypothetical protein CSC14_2328 [Proteus mirabilis]